MLYQIMYFENIFSKFVACLLILLTMYFGEQRLLNLIECNINFSLKFMDDAFEVVSIISLLNSGFSRFSSVSF